jgi:hypothetical protein
MGWRAPSPRVRGEGRDEGALPLGSESRRGPLTLARYAHSTSPRAAGRGDKAIPFPRRDSLRASVVKQQRILCSSPPGLTRWSMLKCDCTQPSEFDSLRRCSRT